MKLVMYMVNLQLFQETSAVIMVLHGYVNAHVDVK